MDCSRCGLSNLPYFSDCSFCNGPLRNHEDAQKRKLEWDALSQAQRDEFSRSYQLDRDRFDDWRDTLKRDLYKHMILGSVSFGGMLTLLMVWVYAGSTLAVAFLILGDLLWGAALGWLLNHFRGGEYRSMLLLGASFLLSIGLKLAAGMIDLSLGFAILFISGFLMMLALGYLFGINLSLQRSIR